MLSGPFKADKYTGTEISYPNGINYSGEIKEEKADGKGTKTWPDGKTYEGQFEGGV